MPKFKFKFLVVRAIKVLLVGCMLVFSVSVYAHKIEPNWLEITETQIELPQLDRAFNGYRIVQISDLHAGDGIDRAQLEKVVTLVNEQNPDLVVITGDLVSRLPRQHVDLLDTLTKLRPRDITLSVLGNHDVFNDAKPVRQAIAKAGVTLLENTIHTIHRQQATLHIAGVGDVFFKQDDLDRVLKQLPATGAAIMLAHEPDFADEVAATRRFGLQLSGHSHGGQIRLPFYDGYVPDLARKYPIGRYQVGDMTQYTNRGIGTIKVYSRFNCRPEISVFSLVAS
ncbi:metallophosphoesterase [Chamaesiphon minutus]|uniref:Putative phosphohydrolase n=1 Tax=Chamaesiphon minutus (strain ATCC 27169 / PCC 6605) TaxID=1173020 RepID=K9UKJ2_CHAP6|nr:metallophosphoesterase [Chamaesiphon minutus]AFY94966.1 putative phosphohydrolase [Chamaesiphon minutus PCC 6605]